MQILVLGGGGREHAIAWKISQSHLCKKLFVAPGNAGTSLCGENVKIDPNDFSAVGVFAKEKNIDMVVVGPEEPLVNGIADHFLHDPNLKSIAVIGPKAEGARLEGSKAFAKAFMHKYRIPTAKYQSFNKDTLNEGLHFLKSLHPPYVLKADGLAAGKGVLIFDKLDEAMSSFKKMINERMFGNASDCVVVEEFLDGKEISVFAATDGCNYILLPEAKDYKRIGEGDTGPNTGGMGCVSPVPFADRLFMEKVRKRIIEPTLDGLSKENIGYKGFIFFGLMNVEGDPYVIEYNVRLGDPEAEAILPRINSDFVQLLIHITDNNVHEYPMEINPRCASAVILASGGYPGKYRKGYEITGLDMVKDSLVFFAGASLHNDKIITSGGRVLAITSLERNFKQALRKSKLNAEKIDFIEKYYRRDIGNDLI